MTRTGEHGTHGREHAYVLEDARCTGGSYRHILSFVSKNRLWVSDRGHTQPCFIFLEILVTAAKQHVRLEMENVVILFCLAEMACKHKNATFEEENLMFPSTLLLLIVLWADTVFQECRRG